MAGPDSPIRAADRGDAAADRLEPLEHGQLVPAASLECSFSDHVSRESETRTAHNR
jgi:hypothetical protein